MLIETGIWDHHPKLYHYTNQTGLLGILASNDLWATSYKFLNDSNEVKYFRQLLQAVLMPVMIETNRLMMDSNPKAKEFVELFGGLEKVAIHEMEVVLNSLYNATFAVSADRAENVHPFICSFCSHESEYEKANGLLSQWRGYGGEGGFALEFDTKLLSAAVKDCVGHYDVTSAHFSSVLYGLGDDVKHELSAELEAIELAVRKIYDRDLDSIKKTFDPLVKGSTILKHEGFREEQEVRIVIAPIMTNSSFAQVSDVSKFKRIYCRDGPRGPVSYIKALEESDHPLPITRIIVGPGLMQDRNFDAVRFAVADRAIDVVKSETPYVG